MGPQRTSKILPGRGGGRGVGGAGPGRAEGTTERKAREPGYVWPVQGKRVALREGSAQPC